MADEPTTEPRDIRRELHWNLFQQLPLLVALVLLWMALWGEISLLSGLSGLLVGIVVTRLFYLPPVDLSGRFNIAWFVVFLIRFAGQLVAGSVVVAVQAFRPGAITRNAVIAVPLRSSSDFVMTLTATVESLVPGSLVIEIDRETATLYLHVLGVTDLHAVERARARVLLSERSIVRALGSRAELERVSAP